MCVCRVCVWVCSLPSCIYCYCHRAITIVRVSIANQRLTNLHAFLSPRTQPGIGVKIMARRHYFRWIEMNDRRRQRARRGCQIDVWMVIRRSHSCVCSRNHLFIFISIYAQRSQIRPCRVHSPSHHESWLTLFFNGFFCNFPIFVSKWYGTRLC